MRIGGRTRIPTETAVAVCTKWARVILPYRFALIWRQSAFSGPRRRSIRFGLRAFANAKPIRTASAASLLDKTCRVFDLKGGDVCEQGDLQTARYTPSIGYLDIFSCNLDFLEEDGT